MKDEYFLIIFEGSNSDMEVPYQIAVGEINPKHGLVQRTRERTKKRILIPNLLFSQYWFVII